MATGIGSLIALLSRKVSYRLLSAALGFSAGLWKIRMKRGALSK